MSHARRDREHKFREAGLCVTCGQEPRETSWRCRGCADKQAARSRRYYWENHLEETERNAQRLYVCGMYQGRCGFTKKERAAMLGGTPD